DQAHHLVEARVGLLLRQLLLLHQAAELSLGDLARLLQAGVDELLVDVLEDDGDVCVGDRLGDLAAHRSGADDGGLEYEQEVPSGFRLGAEGPGGYRDGDAAEPGIRPALGVYASSSAWRPASERASEARICERTKKRSAAFAKRPASRNA